MWFIGVEVEQETSAPPPKKNPGSAPASGALSSKAANRKQIGTKYLQQPGGKEVCFFFSCLIPMILFGFINFCSRHGEVVTAHKESLRIPLQLYSGLILLCEIEFKLFF